MSTYTDLHIRRKENLTILRMPGDPNDGITPQRVILANPENIYEGTFKGLIQSTSAIFDNGTFNNCSLIGGVISNAMIYSQGRVVDVADLTTTISQHEGMLEALDENIDALSGSVKISCDSLQKQIAQAATTSAVAAISVELSASLSREFGQQISAIEQSVSSLSDEMLSCQLSIGNAFVDIDSLQEQLANETSARISADEYLSSQIGSIQERIKGGVVYRGKLDCDGLSSTVPALKELFAINNISSNLSVGYEYIIDAKQRHIVEGLSLENGDWLIVKKDTLPTEITAGDVDIFDSDDYDNFKLNSDNTVNGNTTFKGSISSTSTAAFGGSVKIGSIDDVESTIVGLSNNYGVLSGYVNGLNVDNEISTGQYQIITSLSQSKGKLSVESEALDYKKISGLSGILDGLSNSLENCIRTDVSVVQFSNGNVLNGLSVGNILKIGNSLTLGNGQIDIPENMLKHDAIAIGDSIATTHNTFIWNGNETAGTYKNPVDNNGIFCINPDGGINGFYIGEQNLSGILSVFNTRDRFNRLTSDISSTLSSVENLSSLTMSSTIEQTISATLQIRDILSSLYIKVKDGYAG